jgi:predicted Rossmann fold nucleotide-binding protein DprA/Smf involved in DNA uptake
MEVIDHLGNTELLNLEKTAFLCSREIPASIVLKCYDWAIAQREQGNCIISGFHSKIEKDVLHYLLKGNQSIIVALARGLKKRIEPELNSEIEKGRLLIVTPFEKEIKRITIETAMIRNQLMIDMAENITVGFINKTGNLARLLKQSKKVITTIE